MYTVSVVILTYNRTSLLCSAISSVLNQTYQDFELIVVDDGSTDNTREVVAGFKEKRLRYIRHDRNRGEAEARNTGILNSTGAYIAFLDDDDLWLPEKLELQVRKFENVQPKTGLNYTGYVFVDSMNKENGRDARRLAGHKGSAYYALMKKNIIGPTSTVLFKRECMEKVGLFDFNISYGLDYDYWIRISQHYEFDFIEKPLVKYRVHEKRLSSDIELRARGARDLAKKYGSGIISSDYWRSIYLPLGIELCNKGQMIKGANALLRSIRYYPGNRSSYFYLGMSLLGRRTFKRAVMFKESLRNQLPATKNETIIKSK